MRCLSVFLGVANILVIQFCPEKKKGSNSPAVICSKQTEKFKKHKINVFLALVWRDRMSQWTTIYMSMMFKELDLFDFAWERRSHF
jgi:hypothetical protein